MIRINLLPVRGEKKKESIRQQLSIAGLTILLLCLILGIVYFSINRKIAEFKDAISSEEKNIAILDKEIGELKNIEIEKKIVLEKLNIVKQLDVNRRVHLNLITDVTNALPEKVWIDSIKDMGRTVNITGFAIEEDLVADFMRGLERILSLWKIELEIAQQVDKSGVKLSGFTIRLEKPKQLNPN